MDRLPPRLQTKWAERAENIFRDGGRPRFSDLTAFIQRSADIASNMFGQRLNVNSSRDRSSNRPQQRNRNDIPRRGTTLAVRSVSAPESSHESPREIRNNVIVHPRDVWHRDSSRITRRDVTTDKCISLGPRDVTRSYPPPEVCTSSLHCPLCLKSHFLKDCIAFKAKTYQKRLDLLFQKHICRNCLVPGHYTKGLSALRACERSGCVRKHHTLLHPPDGARDNNDVDHRVVSHQASAAASNGIIGAGRKRVCLRVIPVRVQGLCNFRVIETYALLDDGSDVSSCDHRLLEKLGVNGINRQFTLTTLSNTEEQSGLEVGLKVGSIDGVKDLCLSRV